MPIYRKVTAKPEKKTNEKPASSAKILSATRKTVYKILEKQNFDEIVVPLVQEGFDINYKGRNFSLREDISIDFDKAFSDHQIKKSEQKRFFWVGEVFNSEDVSVDYQAMFCSYCKESLIVDFLVLVKEFLTRLKLNADIKVTNCGDKNEKAKYKNELRYHIKGFGYSLYSQFEAEPDQIFSSTDDRVARIKNLAPKITDTLSPKSMDNYHRFLDSLRSVDIDFTEDHFYSRYEGNSFKVTISDGFDDTVIAEGGGFEISKDLYKTSVKINIGEVCRFIEKTGIKLDFDNKSVYLIGVSEKASVELIKLTTTLKSAGFKSFRSSDKKSYTQQLRSAEESGARYALVIGESEIESNTIVLKDLSTGGQKNILRESLLDELAVRFSQA